MTVTPANPPTTPTRSTSLTKRPSLTAVLAACVTLSLSTAAFAQSGAQAGDGKAGGPAAQEKAAVKPLTIGDKAPPLEISDWLQGERLAEFPSGKVTVVEFWATWCGPCKVSIPHLSEMNDRFKDYGVTVIGISDEPLGKVQDFLAKDEWKSKMRYTVATDPDRSTYQAYMTAAGQSGIPTAFVVGKTGAVEWIGHPQAGLDEVVEQVVKDKWDSAAYKEKFDAQVAAEKAMRAAAKELRAASEAGDWDKVLTIYDDLIAKNPDDVGPQLAKVKVLLTKADRPDEGYALAKSLAANNRTNPMILNDLAWTIVDDPSVTKRDVDFAMGVAKQAVEASAWKSGAIIDTLARCHWEAGDKAKAIELQRKAIEIEGDGPMATGLKKTLAEYETSTAPKQAK